MRCVVVESLLIQRVFEMRRPGEGSVPSFQRSPKLDKGTVKGRSSGPKVPHEKSNAIPPSAHETEPDADDMKKVRKAQKPKRK